MKVCADITEIIIKILYHTAREFYKPVIFKNTLSNTSIDFQPLEYEVVTLQFSGNPAQAV